MSLGERETGQRLAAVPQNLASLGSDDDVGKAAPNLLGTRFSLHLFLNKIATIERI